MCSNQFLWSIAASGDRLEVWQILGRSRAIYRHAQFDLTSGKRAERPSGGQFMHWNCLLIATTVKDIYRGHLNCFWHIMELSELNTEFLLTKKQKQKQLARYNKRSLSCQETVQISSISVLDCSNRHFDLPQSRWLLVQWEDPLCCLCHLNAT